MRASGKFFAATEGAVRVKGVTYGPFGPDGVADGFHDQSRVAKDFAAMRWYGVNAVRTYTVPPRWLLDLASRHELSVLIGIPWEQHVLFLEDRTTRQSIRGRIADAVRGFRSHPAVLGFAVGNEIPASIVRWYGHRRVERFIRELFDLSKSIDPERLVTYVNFPTTEYLNLEFLDFLSFNVYLEDPERFGSYLARLQNLAGDRPLVMGEIGLDSRRNGETAQASSVERQVRTAYEHGCAGVFVFSWTDEWHRSGIDVEDWDFGLTRRDGSPKPALFSVAGVFSEDAPMKLARYPRICVVVCSYNGAGTIRQCCRALRGLNYPNYEVLFVIDGSTDNSTSIVEGFGFRCIATENRGLSSARNTGWQRTDAEIVAYLDDDAFPDPDWLLHLARTFSSTDHAAVGGPNICPPGSGVIEAAVDNAPGGPTHVLLDDTTAEHIPGCNMAVRRKALETIGGFDPQYRIAGDDVDVCWRIRERGWTIGFNPAAMVWHHRRDTVRRYLKQQYNYGKAEAMLEREWPEKYNSAGHLSWHGRIYGKGVFSSILLGPGRIYFGTWGTAPFQRIYEGRHGKYDWLPTMPEVYLFIALLAVLGMLGFLWNPLFLFIPVLAVALGVVLAHAIGAAREATFHHGPPTRNARLAARTLVCLFHLAQPAARLAGRLREGLSPWRLLGSQRPLIPFRRRIDGWTETWKPADAWLGRVEDAIVLAGVRAERCSEFDRWDLRVAGGLLGGGMLRLAVEEHGHGKQYLRWLIAPLGRLRVLIPGFVTAVLAMAAFLDQAYPAASVLLIIGMAFLGRALWESGKAMSILASAVARAGMDVAQDGEQDQPAARQKRAPAQEHDAAQADT